MSYATRDSPAYYNSEMKAARRSSTFDEASYARWRGRIPFTDDDIIAALERNVAAQPNDYMRGVATNALAWFRDKRRLSGRVYKMALPFLVQRCSIPGCGKKALYRFGSEGRCKDDRMVTPEFVKERARSIAARQAEIEALQNEIDHQRRRADSQKQPGRATRKRRK